MKKLWNAIVTYFQVQFCGRAQEFRDAEQMVDKIEAAAQQGGGSVVLPSGREVMVHVVPRGRLDVAGNRNLTTKLVGEGYAQVAKTLSGSRADRLAKAKR